MRPFERLDVAARRPPSKEKMARRVLGEDGDAAGTEGPVVTIPSV